MWKSLLKSDSSDWLLNSNPWTRYATLVDIVGENKKSDNIKKVKHELVNSAPVKNLINQTIDWQSYLPTRNSDPKISYYKLRMLADFGLTMDDVGINEIVEKATAHVIDDMFAVRGSTPVKMKKGEEYKISDPDSDLWHVSPCNSPILTYSLIKIGYNNDQLNKAINQLVNKWEDPYGWFCHFFFVDGQFNKLQKGCPMAGLMALEVFSLIPALKESDYSKRAFDTLKFHYQYGKSLYYFGRSKKFWTLKYPFVWYNALYLADVLTRFEFTKNEPIVNELMEWILEIQNDDGRYKSSSIYLPYKSWDFGNKKEESPWITFLCYRIIKRIYEG